jgi:cytochrome oxidase Cu insertion factor (SCO1/SenC/PrrC family)
MLINKELLMVKLIRHIFAVLFLVAVGYQSRAQSQLVQGGRTAPNTKLKKGTGAKLEAARNNYISRQLDLSDEEGRKFWPHIPLVSAGVNCCAYLKAFKQLQSHIKRY